MKGENHLWKKRFSENIPAKHSKKCPEKTFQLQKELGGRPFGNVVDGRPIREKGTGGQNATGLGKPNLTTQTLLDGKGLNRRGKGPTS